MYNFIFYFFYEIARKRNPVPKFYAVGTVLFAQVLHLLLIVSIVKYFGDFVIPRLHESYYINKWMLAPFAIVWLILLGFYYKRNFEKIEKKYKKKDRKEIFNIKTILFVIGVYIFPLLIYIIFLNLAVTN
jgi:hypothetical protein